MCSSLAVLPITERFPWVSLGSNVNWHWNWRSVDDSICLVVDIHLLWDQFGSYIAAIWYLVWSDFCGHIALIGHGSGLFDLLSLWCIYRSTGCPSYGRWTYHLTSQSALAGCPLGWLVDWSEGVPAITSLHSVDLSSFFQSSSQFMSRCTWH